MNLGRLGRIACNLDRLDSIIYSQDFYRIASRLRGGFWVPVCSVAVLRSFLGCEHGMCNCLTPPNTVSLCKPHVRIGESKERHFQLVLEREICNGYPKDLF